MTPGPTVSLYGHWTCPFVTRVAFALAQRGIRYDVVDVPPSAVRGRDFELPAEFVEHSPRLEIPMLRVGDEFRVDSIPLLEWLEEKIAPEPLLPKDVDAREHVRARVAWIDQNAFRAMVGVYYGHRAEHIARAAAALSAALDTMDGWLAESGWLAGTAPTLAEAVLVPLYVRLDGLRRLGFEHELPARVDEHRRECRALAGWAAVEWSPSQVDEFVGRFEAFRRRKAAVA